MSGKVDVLVHGGDHVATDVRRDLTKIHTTQADGARVRVPEACHEVGDGGLARAGGADERRDRAGPGQHVHPAKDGVAAVGEPDVVELDPGIRRDHGFGGFLQLLHVPHLTERLRDLGLLVAVRGELEQLLEGAVEIERHHEEEQERDRRKRIAAEQGRAQPEQGDESHLEDDGRDRGERGGAHGHADAGLT